MALPTALYIHIPWCIRKCPYCDFNSHQVNSPLAENDYIKALIADFDADLAMFAPREIHTIFIGGGTPSLFSAESFNTLFTALKQRVPLAPNIEITLEANPGTVEAQRFAEYHHIGINRLSLGIQSFNPTHLKLLGRIHDASQAHQAIDIAYKAGFTNINLDLMYGLPNQSISQSLQDLHTAIAYQPQHLSWYQLTIEPNTVFFKQPPALPSEEEIEQIESQGLMQLMAANFNRYEISAFCQLHYAAKHNLNYWLFGDYYGIGAGAHGKITAKNGVVFRTRKYRQPKDYLAATTSFLAGKEQVTPVALLFEFMLNTTRLQQPIPYDLFLERTGLRVEYLKSKLILAAEHKFINMHELTWQVTPLGRRFTNDLQALFLPPII